MSFSWEWETEIYSRGLHESVWPWTALVSYVSRYCLPVHECYRVLELGPGAGANIPYFLSLGVEYFGVEGSPSAVCRLKERFPSERVVIECGDFTKGIPFPGPFDLVVDRGSLTHNGTSGIRSCLADVRSKMASDSRFIGIDWFSLEDSDYALGHEEEDRFTRSGFESGRLGGVGIAHFSDAAHLTQLFSHFEFIRLDHAARETMIPPSGARHATFCFVAVPV